MVKLKIEFHKNETLFFSSSKLIPVVIQTAPTIMPSQSDFKSTDPAKKKNTKTQNIKEPYTFLITRKKGVPKTTVKTDINTEMVETTDSFEMDPVLSVIILR